MGDYAIRMQFDVEADEATVQQALTSTRGIAGWWSDRVEGDPHESGGKLLVHFPDLPEPFEFSVDHDGGAVRWTTGGFPPWWQGTTITWQVSEKAETGAALLRFRHDGFDPEDDIIPIITPAWASIIGRLKHYAEAGTADPFARNG